MKRFCRYCNNIFEASGKFCRVCPNCNGTQAMGKKQGRLTQKQIKEIIEKRAGICEFPECFEMKNLQVHHIRRVSRGGTNEVRNLQVLCKKHHKMVHAEEFK